MTKRNKKIPAKVWVAETEKYDLPFLLESCSGLLSDKEKIRLTRISNQDHKINFLVSRYLLRTALSECDPRINPEEWLIENGDFGKPYLQSAQSPKNLQFNLSHTKGFASCLVVEGYECGVDIQAKNIDMNWEDISKEILSDEEYTTFQHIDDYIEREKRFYQYWVMKESFLKGIGVGLMEDMKRHPIVFFTDLEHPQKVVYKNDPFKWGGQLIDMPHGFFLGISVKQNCEFNVNCKIDVDLKSVKVVSGSCQIKI